VKEIGIFSPATVDFEVKNGQNMDQLGGQSKGDSSVLG